MTRLARSALPLCLALASGWPSITQAGEAATQCSVNSTAHAPTVVELYTSEGCSSCPPADRWLSALQGRSDLVALSFHVDYWDRLGWRDRFSSPAHSQRQAQLLRTNGAPYAYTPQVVVDGRDQPRWSNLALTNARSPSTVQASLQRNATGYRAELRALPGAPARIVGYWALTEDGHSSTVKAGENQGTQLTHDFVVREYAPLAAWDSRDVSLQRLQFSPSRPADAAHPRRMNLVLVDADSGRVLQALALGC
jgi:hypothetical protein